jgi:integrase
LRALISTPLDRLTAGDIEDVILGVAKHHSRTAQIVGQTVRLILKAATKRRQRVSPECLLVTAPTHRYKSGRFLTPSEVERLASATDDATLGNLIRFMSMTGLRISEALDLTDADILSDAVIVNRSKTDAGVRQVPLTKQAKAVVAGQRLARPAGVTYLFPSPTGKQAHLSHTNAMLVDLRKTVGGMENITFHAFRHTFATALIAANIQSKQIAELLGHKDGGRLVEKTYGHLYPNSAAKAVEALGEAWEALG